jgi:hypothetical protein
MGPPVVLVSTSTTAEADMLAAHLRGQGIDASARTHFDRTMYTGLGGAMVQVPADQRVEAEFELMLLTESAGLLDDADEPLSRRRRHWVVVASFAALAGMVVLALGPSFAVIWSRLFS